MTSKSKAKEPEERTDASGRVLNPWEVLPEEQAHPVEVVEEAREGDDDQQPTQAQQDKPEN